jgi:undecaprenyl pyrophosphate phosphatase UppP
MPLLYLAIALATVAILAWILNAFIPLTNSMKRIINVVLALLVVGMALWLINSYVPMAGSIQAILNIVVVVATCVGVLQAFGLWDGVVRLWNGFISRVLHEGSYEGTRGSEHILHPPHGVR